jgi:hypothetical protein
MKKTTIYIDVDDDIATIVDKIKGAPEKIVALVLPKRPTVFHSSVNMRLLKKITDEYAKNTVLITNDDQVLQLAGRSSVHVASSLQSKPKIPDFQAEEHVVEEINIEPSGTDPAIDPAQPEVFSDDAKIDLKTSVGELTGAQSDDDEIELDSDEPTPVVEQTKSKKLKKIAVPNFGSFRNKIIIGGLFAVAILGLGIWGLVFAPSASIVLTTERSTESAKVNLTAVLGQTTVDTEKKVVPYTLKEEKQTLQGSFTPTGKKDLGTKASGQVRIYNCSKDDKLADIDRTVPAGTGISNAGKTFILQDSVTVGPSSYSGNNCNENVKSALVDVVAVQGGDDHNLSPREYSVNGFSTISAVDEDGMSGGTSKIVTVASQSDVDTATQALLDGAADDVKGKLATLLGEEGYVAIQDTYTTSQGAPLTSVGVDQETTGPVSISLELNSNMIGVKKSDIETFATAELALKIDQLTQKVYDSGLATASAVTLTRPDAQTITFSVNTTGSVGPLLDESLLEADVLGKQAGEAKQILETRPGITRADITLSPFWVFSIPKSADKVAIEINE